MTYYTKVLYQYIRIMARKKSGCKDGSILSSLRSQLNAAKERAKALAPKQLRVALETENGKFCAKNLVCTGVALNAAHIAMAACEEAEDDFAILRKSIIRALNPSPDEMSSLDIPNSACMLLERATDAFEEAKAAAIDAGINVPELISGSESRLVLLLKVAEAAKATSLVQLLKAAEAAGSNVVALVAYAEITAHENVWHSKRDVYQSRRFFRLATECAGEMAARMKSLETRVRDTADDARRKDIIKDMASNANAILNPVAVAIAYAKAVQNANEARRAATEAVRSFADAARATIAELTSLPEFKCFGC